MDRDSLARMLDDGLSLAQIGRRFGVHESTVAGWVRKHGLRAVNRDRHAAKGPLAREELARLLDQGMTIAQVAGTVGRSKATVRHWLRRYGLKPAGSPGRRPARPVLAAKADGLRSAEMFCRRHGTTTFVIDGRGVYRCRRCRAEAVSRRRRKVKTLLVEEAGGRCRVCGYDRNMRALHFHHVEPSLKTLEINAKGVTLSLETLREEAKKCVLLCSNFHAEVEDRLVAIPFGDRDGYPGGSPIRGNSIGRVQHC